MTASEEESSSNVVLGATTKDLGTLDISGSPEQNAKMHFDLSANKRPIPKRSPNSRLFDSKTWSTPPTPPAPQVSKYVPPSQPTAPTLPFTFIGRMIDGNAVTLFLVRSNRQYAVKENEVLDDTYRLDSIGEDAAVLTYLPTNTQQALSFNSSLAGISLNLSSESNAKMRSDISTQQPLQN